MGVQTQTFQRYHGEDFSVDLLGPEGVNPSGYAMAWTWSTYPGGVAVLTIDGSAITTGGPDENDCYTISIAHSRYQTGVTLNRDLYSVDLWRSDAGEQTRLAGGQFTLLTPVRSQV